MAHLTILHTNDMHGTLTARTASSLGDRRRSLGGSGLLLDAGDAVASSNVTFKLSGEWMHDLMNSAGYDAMCVGNREFHAWRMGFEAKVRRAAFPVLSANILPRRPGCPLPVASHTTLVTDGGHRVTLFGLTNPMVTAGMKVRHISDYEFELPVATAASMVDQLRPDCDLLVALTHIGLGPDQELARCLPAVDLVIGGHSHSVLPSGMRIGNTLVVQTGARLRHLGVIEIEFGNGSITADARLEEL